MNKWFENQKVPQIRHFFKIKTMDVIQYRRDRDDYTELYKAPDGFYKGNGCGRQKLKSFFVRQKFKIPKEYLLDFLVSRYFIGIAVKSEKHQKFNEKIRKLREVSSGE